jgi:hypothetical protein
MMVRFCETISVNQIGGIFMPLNLIHGRLASSVILYFLAMMVWALWRYFRKEGVNESFMGALVISEILILVQGGLGVFLWLSNFRPERGGMHVLYGIIGVIGIPAIYSFIRGRQNRFEMLAYSATFLCLIGIVFRSLATG